MSLEKPNYNDSTDKALYEELFYKRNNGKPLTSQESDFVRYMYHMEEYASGLDGD